MAAADARASFSSAKTFLNTYMAEAAVTFEAILLTFGSQFDKYRKVEGNVFKAVRKMSY